MGNPHFSILSTANNVVHTVPARNIREALEYAIKHKLPLKRVNLTGADLHEFDFEDTNLLGACLYGMDLTAANLSRANITGICFENARIVKTRFPIECYPVVRIQGSRDEITMLGKWRVDIGCKRMPLNEWLDIYESVGDGEGYTDYQLMEYRAYLSTLQVCVAAHEVRLAREYEHNRAIFAMEDE